jgi:hypothetical protein
VSVAVSNRFAALCDSDDDDDLGTSIPSATLPASSAHAEGGIIQAAGFSLQNAVFAPVTTAAAPSVVLPSAAPALPAYLSAGASFDLSDLANSTEREKHGMDLSKAVQVRGHSDTAAHGTCGRR